ncbi:MAG: hypothetical protein WAV15_03580 [Minisyncoccia bacterium]
MKKRLLKFVSVFSLTAFFPLVASAQVLGDIVVTIQDFLNSIVPVLIALGVVYFVWGVVQFVIGDNEEAKTKGKDRIIFGLIGFAVIIGLWGLVNIVVNSLGFEAGSLSAPELAPIATAPADGTCTMGTNFQGLLGFFTCIINNSVIPLIFAIAVVMFIWGAVKFFIINSDEEAQREQGKQFMIWGIIALTVMTAVWGLVGLLGETFNIGGRVLPQVCPPGSEQCN